MCAMAYELVLAMSIGRTVTVATTQGPVTGRVESSDKEVPEIAGGKWAFVVDGRQVHVASIKEVTRHA